MIDGIIQVNDDNIDDVLDTTYEIMLMFCNGVGLRFSCLMHSMRMRVLIIASRMCALHSFWQSWRSRCIWEKWISRRAVS